ncbi:MAG TPA: MFS transporter [Streptosporangiaceae bacterium]
MSKISASPYTGLLRSPGALVFCAAAFIGRIPMAMYSLGTVLLISAGTGDYALAGAVAAAGFAGSAVVIPSAAALTDHFGQRRILVPQAFIFLAATAAFIACAELRSPGWVLMATGAPAGAAMPSLGPLVRARWSALVGTGPGRLEQAFALESVNDDLISVIGPVLVTALATLLDPAAGIGGAAALSVAGTLAFAAQRRTEPVLQPRPASTPAGRGLVRHGRRIRLPAPGLITLAPVFLLFGSTMGAVDLASVAFATEHGLRSQAGTVLGAFALGSAIGGLWYGTRRWHAPLERRFALSLVAYVAGMSAVLAASGLLELGAAMLVAGVGVSPMLITGYAIVERQAPARHRTEAMAWIGSAAFIGAAGGSALAGPIISVGGGRPAYLLATGCALLSVLIGLAGLGRLRTQASPEAIEAAG